MSLCEDLLAVIVIRAPVEFLRVSKWCNGVAARHINSITLTNVREDMCRIFLFNATIFCDRRIKYYSVSTPRGGFRWDARPGKPMTISRFIIERNTRSYIYSKTINCYLATDEHLLTAGIPECDLRLFYSIKGRVDLVFS